MSTNNAKLKNVFVGSFALGVTVALLSVVLIHLGFKAEAPDQFIQDWRSARFSMVVKEQRKDIVLLLIDDQTLSRFPFKVPTNRRLISDLTRFVDSADPKAIGLDFIFDRPTIPGDDLALSDTLRSSKSDIVLIGTDARESGVSADQLDWQKRFLMNTGRRISDPFFSMETSTFSLGEDVRRRFPEASEEPDSLKSFPAALAESVGASSDLSGQLIDWLLPNKNGTTPFPIIHVPSRDPNDASFQTVLPLAIKKFLKEKVVIIGGAIAGSDWHRIPSTLLTHEKVPGAYIHAQMLAQIIDGRSIKSFSFLCCIGIVFVTTALLHTVLSLAHGLFPEIMLEFLVIGLGVIFGIISFAVWRYNFPTMYLAFSWLGVALFSGYTSTLVGWFVNAGRSRIGHHDEA